MAQPTDPTPPPGSTKQIHSIREIINEIQHLLMELSKELETLEGRGAERRRRKRSRD